MARGFESKSVADQQEQAFAERPARRAAPDSALAAKRRTLELGQVDVRRRLEAAQAPAHREMLKRALAALEDELAKLS